MKRSFLRNASFLLMLMVLLSSLPPSFPPPGSVVHASSLTEEPESPPNPEAPSSLPQTLVQPVSNEISEEAIEDPPQEDVSNISDDGTGETTEESPGDSPDEAAKDEGDAQTESSETPAEAARRKEEADAEQAEAANYDPNLRLSVRYDYDDRIRGGYTIPAFIEVQNDGPALDGVLHLTITPEYESTAVVYQMQIHVDANSLGRFTMPFKSSSTRNVQLHLYRDGTAVAKAKVGKNGVPQIATTLVGILSDQPQDVSYFKSLRSLQDHYGQPAMVTGVPLTAADFPEDLMMMERFNMLVLNHFDIGLLNENQRQTLLEWVRTGGSLLTDADVAGSAALHALSDLLEITVTGQEPVPEITKAIYQYANTALSDQREIDSLSVLSPQGTVLYTASEHPLLTSYPADNGTVYVTSFPLSAPAMAHSGVAQGFFGQVPAMSSISAMNDPMMIAHQSVNLVDAVKSIPWLDAIPVRWIILVAVIFVILVGPVNYIVLSLRDKRDWIWITAPVLAVTFAGIVVGIGFYQHGNQNISSVVNVLDIRSQRRSFSEIGIGVQGPGQHEITLNEVGYPQQSIAGNNYYYYSTPYDTGSLSLRRGEPKINFDITGNPKITFPELPQWNMDTFRLVRPLPISGTMDAVIYLADQGGAYYIKNETEIDLEDVTLVSNSGYVRIPLLTAGEESNGKLTPYKYQTNSQYPSGNGLDYWMVFGELYHSDEYYRTMEAAGTPEEDNRSQEEIREDYAKLSTIHSLWNEQYGFQNIYNGIPTQGIREKKQTIWAWSKDYGSMEISVDGKSASEALNLTVLLDDADYDFEYEGRLSLPAGHVYGVVSNVDHLNPNESAALGVTSCVITDGEVIFDFQLPPEAQNYQLETIKLTTDTYATDFKTAFKDQSTGAWIPCAVGRTQDSDAVPHYVTEDGIVQVKVSRDLSDSVYTAPEAYVDLLSIAVEGRAK